MSILVNKTPIEEFKNQNGLRQGDPLTSFLFLLVAEGLGGLMRMAYTNELFTSIKVGNKNISIPLLQFVDNAIFLGEATMKNALILKCMLRYFELV